MTMVMSVWRKEEEQGEEERVWKEKLWDEGVE